MASIDYKKEQELSIYQSKKNGQKSMRQNGSLNMKWQQTLSFYNDGLDGQTQDQKTQKTHSAPGN